MKMKKKYIAPRVEIATCILDSFIATSPGQGGDSQVGGDGISSVTPTDEIDNMHAKQFDAWSSWDE